jgi:hypothetical protein
MQAIKSKELSKNKCTFFSKEDFKKTIFLVGMVYLSTFMLACGPAGSSKPTQKYDQLRKNSIPEKPVTVREQSYIGSDIYSIRPETNLEFITGQVGEMRIKAMLQIPGAQYHLTSQDLPEGATLIQDANNPLFVTLSWKPSTDVIPRGQSEIKGEFHVALVVDSVPDPQSQTLLKTINTETTLSYTVKIAQDRPIIKAINGLPEKIVEGSVVENFTVEVEDNVSDRGNPPTLEIYYKGSESKESKKANGTMFVALKGAATKKEGQSNWIFNLTFDAKTLAVPEFSNEGERNKNPNLDVTFYIKAVSANNAMSAETKVDRTIAYNKAIAKPQFTISQKPVSIAQGSLLHLSFSTMLVNGRGTLSIKLDDGITGWSGQPNLTCEDAKDPAVELQTCDFSWQVPCDAKAGDYTVKVMAGASYNGQDSSSVLTKTIKVSKADVCQPPKAASIQSVDSKKAVVAPAPKDKKVPAPKKPVKAKKPDAPKKDSDTKDNTELQKPVLQTQPQEKK